ncbi:MAG: hypothetical protein MUD12_17280, partial [Spirochaetes bacterium]|nr:hypothetical protein [Spirochaetota bacterium]
DQDSILFIPRGGKTSYLIGTNKSGYPGYECKIELPVLNTPENDRLLLTGLNGCPFRFNEGLEIMHETYCGNNAGRFLADLEARKDWRELE